MQNCRGVLQPQVLDVLRSNVDANGLAQRAMVQQIDWKRWRGEPVLGIGMADLVLGADLLYATGNVKVWERLILHLCVLMVCK
jgi:CxxC motif-containing protein (DUF1111 family)